MLHLKREVIRARQRVKGSTCIITSLPVQLAFFTGLFVLRFKTCVLTSSDSKIRRKSSMTQYLHRAETHKRAVTLSSQSCQHRKTGTLQTIIRDVQRFRMSSTRSEIGPNACGCGLGSTLLNFRAPPTTAWVLTEFVKEKLVLRCSEVETCAQKGWTRHRKFSAS